MSMNYDVLCIIASFLSITDLLSMMRTCKDMYMQGVGRLLSSGVHLTDRTIPGFCQLVFKDKETRLAALRQLSFSITYYGSCPTDQVTYCIRLLVEVLTHATNLRSVSISHYDNLVR